jgi:hypothetical protein
LFGTKEQSRRTASVMLCTPVCRNGSRLGRADRWSVPNAACSPPGNDQYRRSEWVACASAGPRAMPRSRVGAAVGRARRSTQRTRRDERQPARRARPHRRSESSSATTTRPGTRPRHGRAGPRGRSCATLSVATSWSLGPTRYGPAAGTGLRCRPCVFVGSPYARAHARVLVKASPQIAAIWRAKSLFREANLGPPRWLVALI